ncbi:Uncharacterized protein Fot_16139 [Forsythia ovata]|uniref:Uncharacterized protein n=1 Tax=Forsythia ovata TaxID=205694 RepID=A0ABD1WBG6_9LAMI
MTDGLEDNGEKCDEKAFGKEPADNSGASTTHDEFQEGCTLNSLREDNIVESCASEASEYLVAPMNIIFPNSYLITLIKPMNFDSPFQNGSLRVLHQSYLLTRIKCPKCFSCTDKGTTSCIYQNFPLMGSIWVQNPF